MKRVTKVRVFADLEKEEAYINKMNQKGFGCHYSKPFFIYNKKI